MRRAGIAAVALVAALPAACSTGGSPEASSSGGKGGEECGIPKPKETVDASALPGVFSLQDTGVVNRILSFKDGYSVVVQFSLTVEKAYEDYTKALPKAGYEIIGSDYEGFEAEIYLQHTSGTGALQLRQTECDGVILAYVKVLGEKL